MGFPRRDRRGESKTVGLFKMLPPKNPEPFPSHILKQPLMRYHAIADRLFSGKWLALPLNYIGRGIVYIFGNRKEAEEKAAEVNKRQGFK